MRSRRERRDRLEALLAAIDGDAIAQAQALALREPLVVRPLRLALEVVHAERIGREQAVVARVPPRRMTDVPGMVEQRDADRAAFDGAAVVDEPRALAPDRRAGD